MPQIMHLSMGHEGVTLLVGVDWYDMIVVPEARRIVAALLYVLGALLCMRAMNHAKRGWERSQSYPDDRRSADRTASYRATWRFWAMLMTGFIGLGLARHFSVLSWVKGRAYAAFDDIMSNDSVRAIAAAVVLIIASIGLVALFKFYRKANRLMPRLRVAFIGLAILGAYFVLRLAPVAGIQSFMDAEVFGLKTRWLIELTGIACIAWCTVKNGWRSEGLGDADTHRAAIG